MAALPKVATKHQCAAQDQISFTEELARSIAMAILSMPGARFELNVFWTVSQYSAAFSPLYRTLWVSRVRPGTGWNIHLNDKVARSRENSTVYDSIELTFVICQCCAG
jgi:hypothetical protein